jgi:hypothetical protein
MSIMVDVHDFIANAMLFLETVLFLKKISCNGYFCFF